jgi:hypothetical protein
MQKRIFLLISFLIILIPCFAYADPLDNWHWRNPLPTGNTLHDIAYGNDIFIAVGKIGTIITSSDGINWTMRNSGTTKQISHVAFGNETFVVVGEAILTSTDGINWTDRTLNTSYKLENITYGNGIFVAKGLTFINDIAHGVLLTSPDGITWTPRITGIEYCWINDLTYGKVTFVAVGGSAILQSDSLGLNNPPYKPILIYPMNGQHGLGTTVTFKWKKSTDPDGDPLTYELYVCDNQSFTECNPVRTSSVNNKVPIFAGITGYTAILFLIGLVISGGMRGRRKIVILIASLMVAGMLVVSCGDGDDEGDTEEIAYTISGLSEGTTYYWKVIADDGNGWKTESDVWSFTTR